MREKEWRERTERVKEERERKEIGNRVRKREKKMWESEQSERNY